MVASAVCVLPAGDAVVHEDNLHARRNRLVERRRHARIDRRDGDALHALGDHLLDERDLAFDVGRRLALAVDDLDVRMVLGPGLGGVFHRLEVGHRELGDVPDLDLVGRQGGSRYRNGERQAPQHEFQSHGSISLFWIGPRWADSVHSPLGRRRISLRPPHRRSWRPAPAGSNGPVSVRRPCGPGAARPRGRQVRRRVPCCA